MKHLHSWDVLAISCIDGRFIKRIIGWVSEQTGGVFDFRTEVGTSKAILDSEADRARFFNVIETSIKLHNIKEVWLIDHIDCGAYGGSKRFENKKDEKKFHLKELSRAGKLISNSFPKLKVKKIYAGWENVELVD